MTTAADISPEAVERIHGALIAFTKQRQNDIQTAAPLQFVDAASLAAMLRALRSALTASEKREERWLALAMAVDTDRYGPICNDVGDVDWFDARSTLIADRAMERANG